MSISEQPVKPPVKRWGKGIEQFPLPTTHISADTYRDPDHLAREIDVVLRRHWIFGCVSSQIPNPGDYKVWEHLGETVIIARQPDGSVKAFHNVCMHRGARIAWEDGHCDRYLTCKWHGWKYDIEGDLVRVPKRDDFDPAALDGLRAIPVACEEWKGTIWLNLGGSDVPLLEHLGELVDEFEPFGLENMRLFHHQTRKFDANWKAVLDGFNEAYHGAYTHQVFDDNAIWNLDQMSLPMMGLHDAFLLPHREFWDEIVETEDHHRYATCHYLAFPNTIFLFQPVAGTLNIMLSWPTGVGTTDFEFYMLAGPDVDDELIAERPKYFNMVLDEDEFAMVQSGATLTSSAYTRNLFGAREGRLTNLANNLARLLAEDEAQRRSDDGELPG